MRVKILFNKKENALVQMTDSTQAQLGNGLHMLSVVFSCKTPLKMSQVFKVSFSKTFDFLPDGLLQS